MRIFNVSRRMSVDGQEIFDNLNGNLNFAEITVIVKSLEKFKTDDPLLKSNQEALLSNLKNFVS